MRKRNRRLNEGFSTAALTGRWMLVAVIAVSLSLLYVWQHVQLVRTGYAIKRMERDLEKWQKANEALHLANERLKNPQRVEQALMHNKLGLVFPQAKDIVRLRYPRHSKAYGRDISGSEGGTDTLLSYMSCGGSAAGRHNS
ncbi:MAG: hypothetical protein IT574_10075 [Candidatus Aureabacteria bacterium]|nr:hypothetical protein [Candidatus Auribacterota bacterium]